MADPRDAFRASLDEEWGERRDRPGLEARVARRLSEAGGGGSHRSERWLALATGVVSVILLGALGANALGLMAHHQDRSAVTPVIRSTPAAPSPSPSSTVAAEPDYGPAPIGTPLFYYVDPRDRTWMVALDWTGQPRGTLKLPQRIEDTGGYGGGGVLAVAPDGSRIILGSQVVDARGRETAAGIPTDKRAFGWADDSRHLCQMVPSSSDSVAGLPQTLVTFLPGGAARVAARVGTAYNQAGASAYACSFLADRALVVQAYNGIASESWLVRLATGAVLHHQTYPRDLTGNSVLLVTTHDGLYVADNTTIFSATPNQSVSAGPSVIRSGLSGAKLATMPTGLQVMGFSWDGSLAVLQTTNYGVHGPAPEVRVVDWRSGRVVWRLDAGKAAGSAGAPLALDQVLAAPSSRDLALSFSRLVPCTIVGESPAVQSQCGSSYDRLRDVILVHANGSSHEVATRVQPVW